MELFTAGPRYSHAGNPKLTDEDVTLVRRCSVWLISSLLQVKTVRDFVLDNPYEGERRHSAMLKAQEGINVSASWIRDLRNSEPVEEKIRVRFSFFASLLRPSLASALTLVSVRVSRSRSRCRPNRP